MALFLEVLEGSSQVATGPKSESRNFTKLRGREAAHAGIRLIYFQMCDEDTLNNMERSKKQITVLASETIATTERSQREF